MAQTEQDSTDWSQLPGEVTAQLQSLSEGDPEALNRLFGMIYQQLRKLAQFHLNRESNNHTLQPTELINEVYLNMIDNHGVHFSNRLKFFSFAGFMMRRVLVQHARSRDQQKRGGRSQKVLFDEDFIDNLALDFDPGHTLDLDRALTKLSHFDRQKGLIAVMRYFAGLNVKEVAQILDRSPRTIQREWRFTRHWLARELSQNPDAAK